MATSGDFYMATDTWRGKAAAQRHNAARVRDEGGPPVHQVAFTVEDSVAIGTGAVADKDFGVEVSECVLGLDQIPHDWDGLVPDRFDRHGGIVRIDDPHWPKHACVTTHAVHSAIGRGRQGSGSAWPRYRSCTCVA